MEHRDVHEDTIDNVRELQKRVFKRMNSVCPEFQETGARV